MQTKPDNRTKCTYARTNPHVRWEYSEWCGRWETLEDCIQSAREHFPRERFEYRVEDLATGEVITGFADGAEEPCGG